MNGSLPSHCLCDNDEGATNFVHITHGVESHDDSYGGPAARDLIDKLTVMDKLLFRSALLRFLCEVRALEATLGERLICRFDGLLDRI